MPIKNPIVRAQLTAFEAAFSYDPGKETENFERYSIFSIANGREGLNVNPEDMHLPTDDFGIDGAGLVISGEQVTDVDYLHSQKRLSDCEVFLFQSKTSEGLDYGDMSKFFDACVSIFSGHKFPQSIELTNFSDLITCLFENAAKFTSNPNLTLYYAVTGKAQISEHIRNLIAATKERIESKSLFTSVEIFCVGADSLPQYYRQSTDAASATFPFRNRISLPEEEGVKEAHIGFISAADLVKMISIPNNEGGDSQKINRKLFFDNVRDYDAESEINRTISSSIKKSPTSFVFRNNGVTIVARDGRAIGNNFHIEGYQIVNGCQTSNVIFENREISQNVHVPLRVIVSDDAELVNEIIVSTNRQNPVKEEQFWALRPFLKNFEEYARNQALPRTLYFERRENQYRFDDVPERARIIDAAALLKSVVAMFLCLPNRAGRDFRQIKKDYDDQLFQPEHSVKPYHAAAYAHYRVEYLFRNRRIDASYKIYRMFIIWYLGRRAHVELMSVSLAHSSIDKISDKILTDLDDEVGLIKQISDFVSAFTAALTQKGIVTKRDALRSDEVLTVAKEVATNLLSSAP